MDTFSSWEAEVLDHTFDHVDYVSVHTYYSNPGDDIEAYLAKSDLMGDFIDEVVAACDYVTAKRRSPKRIMLSFDEWDVWVEHHNPRAEEDASKWPVAPHLLEDTYSMEDALVVGGMLITLLNHADRAKVGCIAQVVNVIAPIRTVKGGSAWRQTIFYPFLDASRFGRGKVLRQVVNTPVYDTEEREAVPYLTSSCVFDTNTESLTVFAVNRSTDDKLQLSVDLRSFDELQVLEWATLRHDDLKAVNTCETPDAVTPASASGAAVRDATLRAVLEPASWNVIRLVSAAA